MNAIGGEEKYPDITGRFSVDKGKDQGDRPIQFCEENHLATHFFSAS